MRKGVIRPAHVGIRVLELEPALQHYTELLGLIETHRDAQGRVYLKGWTETDLYSVVLREADEAGMDFMGFKVFDDQTLTDLGRDLKAWGVDVVEVPAGELDHCGRRLRFMGPMGHVFELYADKQYTGRWGLSQYEPEAWPLGLKGMGVQRFDHCQLHGRDLDAQIDLFTQVLGFYLCEYVEDEQGIKGAAFLSLAMKAHDVAFIRDERHGTFHHAAFYLETWQDVLKANDLISMTRTSLDTSSTRHGITHGQTTYFFDPSGNRNEAFTGGDVHFIDQKPSIWRARNIGRAIFYHNQKLSDKFMTALT